MNYLVYLETDRKLAYSTVNLNRSAISLYLPKIDSRRLQSSIHNSVDEVFNSHPPLPRYSETWDVSIVVNYFANLPNNSLLDLKQLTNK